MKQLFTLFAFCALCFNSTAQCVPDPSLNIPGLYPPQGSTTDSLVIVLPDAAVNAPSSYVIQIKVLADTTVSIGGFVFNVPVDSLGILSVAGLPAGMSYGCDVPDCKWLGGGNGCIELSGTPTAIGSYDLTAIAETKISVAGILDTAVETPFFFRLNVVPAANLFESRPIDFRLDPNPASDFVDIRINRNSQQMSYRLVDMLGRTAQQGQFRPTEGHYRLTVDELKNGLYVLHLGNDGGWVSRRLFIAR